MRYKLALFILVGFITSCHTTRYASKGDDKLIGMITLGKELISKYLVKDSIERIRAIQFYSTPCGCGVRACASNTIGIDVRGDTIRVLRLCDSTKNIKLGIDYTILKENPPPFDFTYYDDIIGFPASYHVYFGKLVIAN